MSRALVLAVLAFSAPALADTTKVYVGGPAGSVLVGDPVQGNFQFLGICGGAVNSMTSDGTDLLLGSPDGHIYRFDTKTGQVIGGFDVKSDAAAIAMYGPDLLVGGSDGSFQRVNAQTGEVVGKWQALATIDAMAVDGNEVWTGAHDTSVLLVNPENGQSEWKFACGGAVDSMAVTETRILLGTLGGTVYIFDRKTNNYVLTYNLPHDGAGLGLFEGKLLVAGSNGTISVTNPETGQVFGSFKTGIEIGAMAVVTDKGCLADFNADGRQDLFDFLAFVNAFVAHDPSADVDQSTGPGTFDLFDFLAYQNHFAAGC